ncbi:MAG: prepilin-type N-terminal cleavage/methylation domain-containing protein [Coriobacteriia bacterium]|nr:prepilin-type N-terminal cleavage/methylation domain-containing protein [Coriobacteriia bacterium]
MRGVWYRLNRDDGMTIVEVMIAAAIFFIILTAVLALVGQTTQMGLQAKQKNIMTNTLNAYIESVHALPFEDVALIADGGTLEPERVETIAGYTVTINPTVTVVSGNTALKNLRVDISISDPRGVGTSTFTRVVIRDRTQFLTQEQSTPMTDPAVEFFGLTPPSGTVVWGSEWEGGPLYLDVRAEASEGRIVKLVRISFGGLTCEDASDPPKSAVWTPDEQSWTSTSELFTWNTEQFELVEQADGSFESMPLVTDGMRTMQVRVTDDAGIEKTDEIYLLVDNYAPPAPSGLAVTVTSARAASAVWSKTMDGDYGADSYALQWVKQGAGHTDDDISPFGLWGEAGTYELPDASDLAAIDPYAMTVVPFSRYAARVQAVSPRDLASGWTETTPFVSRPLLSGNYVVVQKSTGNPKYWKVTSTLSVTTPTFPTTGTTTYAFYRVDGSTPTLIQSGTSTTCTDAVQVNVNPSSSNFPARSYRVVVSYTPDGYAGGSLEQATSNTVSTMYNPAGTYAFAEGTW